MALIYKDFKKTFSKRFAVKQFHKGRGVHRYFHRDWTTVQCAVLGDTGMMHRYYLGVTGVL